MCSQNPLSNCYLIYASLCMINVCVGVLHPKNTSKFKQFARESIFASSLMSQAISVTVRPI